MSFPETLLKGPTIPSYRVHGVRELYQCTTCKNIFEEPHDAERCSMDCWRSRVTSTIGIVPGLELRGMMKNWKMTRWREEHRGADVYELRAHHPCIEDPKGNKIVDVHGREYVRIESTEPVEMIVRRMCRIMADHEVDEGIFFNGKQPFDPHRDERK